MNTLFCYEYRDYGNFHVDETIIFPGEPTQECIDSIYSNMMDEDFFIPSQVGLEDLQKRLSDGEDLGSLDHIDHTILEISLSEAEPTTTRTFADFANVFSITEWDANKAVNELGLAIYVEINYLKQFIK